MSYCRWSSNNFRCDVYVYEDVSGGWTTHVAGYRHLFVVPGAPGWLLTYSGLGKALTLRLWLLLHNLQMRLLAYSPMRPIGLAYDGESFNDDTPGACANRLTLLKVAGYRVPQHAIDTLRAEHMETEA